MTKCIHGIKRYLGGVCTECLQLSKHSLSPDQFPPRGIFSIYLQSAALRTREVSTERVGQAYFNALHELAPQIAEQIQATSLDPFHDDARLGAFLAKVDQLFRGES